MPTEAGDKKLLGNFRQLIDHISAAANYNPANAELKETVLETKYTAAQAATDEVSAKLAPNKLAISDRQRGFDDLRPLITRAHNFLKASGAAKEVVEDAKSSLRKLTGVRKVAKVKNDPKTPDVEGKVSHSASQMSYDNQLGNLGAYLAILAEVPSYNPNEADLKLAALQAVALDLQAKNDTVSASFATLSQARGLRDQGLYSNKDSVVNTALLVKAYVKAAFGTNSQLFQQIRGLAFSRRGKRA